MTTERHIDHVRSIYDQRAVHGPYGVLAPHNRGGKKSKYVAAVFETALKPFLGRIGKDDRVLDLGCGTGLGMKQIMKRTRHVFGVDISANMLRMCRDFCGEDVAGRLARFDGVSLPFPSHVFHHCVMREVLCHIPDDVAGRLLASLHACMRPQASFYVIDQVSSHPDSGSLILKRNRRQIVSLTETAGFRLEHYSLIRHPQMPWAMLFQLGLLPESLIYPLAKAEVLWHQRRRPEFRRSWRNVLMVFSA